MKRANNKYLFKFSVIVVLTSMLVIRCTPEKQFRVLSFFFDGVPDPNKKTEEVLPVAKDSTGALASLIIKPESYLHKPFAENKCKSCHESDFSNSLIKPIPLLCYTCHEDFNNKFQVLHGPVASGNCMGCHNQHEAKFEKLLDREGQQICLFCHKEKQVLKNKVHEKIGAANCTQCHNPHGGENRGILKKEACYNCHENFANKYNFLHGPVVSGNCGGCHDSHGSKTVKLLLRESQQICLFCHNADQVFKNNAHKKVKTKNCTECHNPHGGEDKDILVESLRPYKTKPNINPITPAVSDSLTNIKSVDVIKKDSTEKSTLIQTENKVGDNQKEKKTNDSIVKTKVVNKSVALKQTKTTNNNINSSKIVKDTKRTEPSVTNVNKNLEQMKTQMKIQKENEKNKSETGTAVPFINKTNAEENQKVGYAPEDIQVKDKAKSGKDSKEKK